MRRIYQITSLAFLGVGLFLVYQGRALGLAGQFGPGPGFFAFWIGVTLAVLSLVWCGQVSLQAPFGLPAGFVPGRAGTSRVVSVVLALWTFTLLLELLGFNLAMFGLLMVLLLVFGREYLTLKIAISIAASFGVHYVFERLLRVPLPYSSIGFLRNMGL